MLGAVTSAPRCPTCQGPVVWEGNSHRPFCSDRCRLVDLGAWITERYRLAGEDAPREQDPGDPDESGRE